VYATIVEMADVDRLAVGTFGWDRNGAPVARGAHGWHQVGGDRIADLADRLPLLVPLPLPLPHEVGLPRDVSLCETCTTEEQEAAKPVPAEPGYLVDRVAELIQAEFPDTHPHSRVNKLRAELAAARIITFLRTGPANAATPGTGQHADLRGNPEPFDDGVSGNA
jgi:hypothetical protein